MLSGFIARYHSADGGSSGTNNQQQQNAGTDSGSENWQLPPAAASSFQRALEQRYNQDAMLFAQRLYDENHTLRRRVDELRGRVPAEGATVLTSDDAKLWTEYKALGVPADVKQQIAQGQTAITERDTLSRDKTIREAADATGYKPSVLTTLAEKDKLAVSVRESNGTREAVVTIEGQQPIPLTAYAEQHWADFLPALQSTQPQPQASGTKMIPQTAGGKKPELDMVSAFIKQAQEQRDSAPNPLKRG
jgi:hypothetical protein